MREFRDGHERLSARTSLFAECPDPALGKEILKKYEYNLCRVLKIQHSAKLFKKRKKNFIECSGSGTRQSINQKKMFAECLPVQHSAKKLSCKIKELATKNNINVHIQQKIH